MRNVDQGAGTLGESFTQQVGRTVLRDDVLCLETGGHHAGAGRQQGLDLGVSLRGGRGERDEGFTAFGEGAAVHEVVLSAYARVDHRADRVGADLARQIDLQRRIDGHDLRILADAERVVRPCHVLHDQVFVVVHVFVKPLRAESQRREVLARKHLLLRVVDHTAPNQGYYPVGECFGVESQVFMIAQGREYRVGDAAHADLEGRTVGNQLGDVAADLAVDFAGLGGRKLHQRFIDFDGGREFRDVDQRIAVGERHVGVDLGDNDLRTFGGRNREVGRGAEAAIAVRIGARTVQQRYVDRDDPLAEKPRDLAQKSRDGLSVPLSDPVAHGVRHEEAIYEETVFVFGLAVGRFLPSDGEG